MLIIAVIALVIAPAPKKQC